MIYLIFLIYKLSIKNILNIKIIQKNFQNSQLPPTIAININFYH